jgi:hypothetical protein
VLRFPSHASAGGPWHEDHRFGDAALVSLVGEATGTYKGKPFADKSKGVDFFARRDGRWQVVNSQMTTIKE